MASTQRKTIVTTKLFSTLNNKKLWLPHHFLYLKSLLKYSFAEINYLSTIVFKVCSLQNNYENPNFLVRIHLNLIRIDNLIP